MPPLDAIVTVTLAGFALAMTPGPSMFYVLSRSIGQSRTAGFASALGLGLGGVLLAIATALGLSALFAKFDILVTILRYLGSIYLVWLGINMIWEARKSAQVTFQVQELDQQSFLSIIRQGVVVEFLNPKTVLFFALFLPPFVTNGGIGAADTSIQMQLLILGALVPLTAIPSDVIVAFLAGTLAGTINRKRMLRECLAWAGGLMLIAIAINLHFGLL